MFSVCRPPNVTVSLEFSKYDVREDIRQNNYALQVCAVSTDVFLPVVFTIESVNGTALG